MGRLLDYFHTLQRGTMLEREFVNVVNKSLSIDDAGPFIHCPIGYKRGIIQGGGAGTVSFSQNWCQQGYFLKKYYSWVIPDRDGKINSHLVLPGQDALSLNFSGCVMARFTNHKRTETYVGHIYLAGQGDIYDCRDIWAAYCKESDPNISIFRPKTLINCYEDRRWSKWGLITASNKAYEIIVCYDTPNQNRVSEILFENIKEVKLTYSYKLPDAKDDPFKP